MTKYILWPGYVRSLVDGQAHFISAKDLARLYGVKMADCLVVPHRERPHRTLMNRILSGEFTVLRPRPDGKYRRRS